MASKPSTKAEAWQIFDHIVAAAAPRGEHTNPWAVGADGQRRFEPDFGVLEQLLGVPLLLKAGTQTGVPALALDVWVSYELRRAGFAQDQVWPRPVHPRILPAAASALITALPARIRNDVIELVAKRSSIKDVTSASGSILGKNYLKQVDVIIADWATGPELLISTKRMDSSYGKNAPNRVEESYGDAKNLRLRHPLAALGFVFGLRSDILQKEPGTADWMFDLLAKLGQEDDAYHATCLVLMDYDDAQALEDVPEEPEGVIEEPGPELEDNGEAEVAVAIPDKDMAELIKGLPRVTIVRDRTPDELAPDRFLATMVTRVLAATPVTMHKIARGLRTQARQDIERVG